MSFPCSISTDTSNPQPPSTIQPERSATTSSRQSPLRLPLPTLDDDQDHTGIFRSLLSVPQTTALIGEGRPHATILNESTAPQRSADSRSASAAGLAAAGRRNAASGRDDRIRSILDEAIFISDSHDF